MRRRTRGPQSVPPAVHQEVGRGQGCSMGEEGTKGALPMDLPLLSSVHRGQGGLSAQRGTAEAAETSAETGAEEEGVGSRAAKEEGGQARALPLLQGRKDEDALRQLRQAPPGAAPLQHGWQPCLPHLQAWLPGDLLQVRRKSGA